MNRSRPDEVEPLIDAFIDANRAAGFDPRSEASLVLAQAASYGGWRYRITRELRPGLIDCSTLVSQAHWTGAGIGVPFVAETQRLAYSALPIAAEDRQPADVLVAYPSRKAAPDGRHNHVVLYLGRHPRLGEWVIESASGADGVRVRPFRPDDLRGGVRRFLPSPQRVSFPDDGVALRLARAVPKLGRLGARLTSGLASPPRHRGVDIYGEEDFPVIAPVDGLVTRERIRGRSRLGAVHLRTADGMTALRLGGIEWTSGAPDAVGRGDRIGVCRSHPSSLCNSIPGLRGRPRLHLEMWSRSPLPFHAERGLPAPEWARPDFHGSHDFNPIYAIKLGLIGAPIEVADLTVLVTLPASRR